MKSLNNFTSNQLDNLDQVKGGTFGCFSFTSCFVPKTCFTPISFSFCQPKTSCYTSSPCYSAPKSCNSFSYSCKTPQTNECSTPPAVLTA